jgi:DNA-binding NtrC family response regulator
VPPLRERPEDILAITHDYLQRHAEKTNQPVRPITADAEAALLAYPWPGNVRELRNRLESLLIMTEGPIDRRHLPTEVLAPAPRNGHVPPPAPVDGAPSIVTKRSEMARPLTMEEGEKQLIADAMQYTGWNKTKAAEVLGIGRHTLAKKIKDYGLDR